jgi:cytochrome c-type biogenesis protein CcmH
MMKKIFLFLIIFIFPGYGLIAAEDYYQFDTQEQQQRFQTLTTELRCLVCQNQNLAESNSGLASDLRGQIYQKVKQGQSDPEIIHYLVNRYGDFILYRPPFNPATLGLWIGPFLFLIIGLSYLIYYIRKKQRE